MTTSKLILFCFMISTALLLPPSAFADPQLSTSMSVSSCWEDSSITNGECQNYNHNQTAPPGTSLSDSGTNSEAPWASAASSMHVFYGSCGMDGSAAATSSADAQILGSGSNSMVATWYSEMMISSPGLDGQGITVRMTFHASGDASGSSSSYYADGTASYSYSVGDGYTGAGFSGNYHAGTSAWDTDGPPTRTFTFDATCTVGQPCGILHTVTWSVGAGTGEPDFGDAQNAAAEASGNLSFSNGSVQVLDPNNDNQPMSYTMTSEVGCGAGQVLQAGAPYGGFTVTNCADNRFGTTFSLPGGTASQNTNVTANFVAPPEVKLASDAVELTGTDSDPVVVQMNYDPVAAQSIFGSLLYVEMGWFHNSTGIWKNAILGNTGATMPTFFNRAYNPATDFHLGYYGNDTTNHVVWAVVNHNSEFGVLAPLDVLTVVSEKTHGAAGTFDINMPLSGTRGVECRSPGANNSHTLIVTFTNNLVSGNASVTSGTGSVAGTPTVSGNKMTINLTGVTNGQTVTLQLNNVKDASSQVLPDTSVNVGFLLGDTNGSGSVTASDISQTKLQSGQSLTATNFREDVNVSGSVTASDVSLVKLRSGTALP